jgi:hypothetical protein
MVANSVQLAGVGSGNLYRRVAERISQRRPSGGLPIRDVVAGSELLRSIALEMGYRPPARRGLRARIKDLQERANAPGQLTAAVAKEWQGRREELSAKLVSVEAGLAGYAASFNSDPRAVAELLGQRAALDFLLDAIPETAPAYVAPAPGVDVRDSEIARARAWVDRLEVERRRIARDISGMEARGDDSVLTGLNHPLARDLADVLRAISETGENLTLARSPLS